MGLVNDSAGDRTQAIPEALARVVVGAPGGHRPHRFAGRCQGAFQGEEMVRFAVLALVEIQMRQEQVLIEPAGGQLLTLAVPVEPGFPAAHLLALPFGQGDPVVAGRGALGQPGAQGVEFVVTEGRRAQRHAAQRVLLGVVVHFVRRRALVVPLEAQGDLFRQALTGLETVGPAQFQHPVEQRLLQPAFAVDHRKEAALAPLGGGLRVDEKTGGVGRLGTLGVHRHGRCAAVEAGGGFQFQLAGRVVAAVAGDALLLDDRPDLLVETHRRDGGRGIGRRRRFIAGRKQGKNQQ